MSELETKMIENNDGTLAVNLNQDSRFNGWVMYKHPDGQWVSLRLALPQEIFAAQFRLDLLKSYDGEPQRGW